MFWTELFLVMAICTGLCVLAYIRKILTWDGAVAALVFGIVIGVAGGLSWVLLLLLFLLTSFAATRYKFSIKRKRGIQEGISGERGWKNVVANGLVPFIIAILTLDGMPFRLDGDLGSILFLCAVAVAASDTLASELGVLARKTWLITTLKPVKAGVDGGVSLPGQAFAALAAIYTGIAGTLTFHFMDGIEFNLLYVILIADIGFLGCQLDSVIGATLETDGKVSKLTNNLASISVGTIIAWMVMTWLL
jgi:uncharacterized protein (TIGR00297 family)